MLNTLRCVGAGKYCKRGQDATPKVPRHNTSRPVSRSGHSRLGSDTALHVFSVFLLHLKFYRKLDNPIITIKCVEVEGMKFSAVPGLSVSALKVPESRAGT